MFLPFPQNSLLLEKYKDKALQRLNQLENSVKNSIELHKEYNVTIYDYLEVGHMSRVTIDLNTEHNENYISHHADLSPESTTTKLRVFLNAFYKISSGYSLNNYLFCVKKLQQNQAAIVLRFRLHPVVITADIKQKFRQIIIIKTHWKYKRLLYRFSLEESIEEYQVNTVTFEQKSSPLLAICILHELAVDETLNPLVKDKI